FSHILLRARLDLIRESLSPYTALFRSCHQDQAPFHVDRQVTGGQGHGRCAGLILQRLLASEQRLDPSLQLAQTERLGEVIVGPQDRKSTRLNSSHVQISYAFFFFKNKN